ncbi:MAG TPA: alkaline phosphatase family protein [Thermoanaerobaculia bacterium]|nr:alkaline phosphatase family protein [Thermoanaerobaculia bacterium]
MVSHAFGNESEEELDTLRRLDRELGRLLIALDALAAAEPKGRVVLALSADHGFTPLPEVVRRNGGKRIGGRLQSMDSGAETPYPNTQERLNRALSDALCLPRGSQPIYGIEGWTVAYDRSVFPAQTVEGPCGDAGRPVTLADLDRVFPEVVRRLYGEEIEDVLLISQRDRWPADGAAVSFAGNDFDAQRSGDAFLVPREYVLMHWDPERGSGHGSHHEYDTHVPVLFWGAPFAAKETDEACAPYDLAPTLADVLGFRLPEATGTSHVPRR